MHSFVCARCYMISHVRFMTPLPLSFSCTRLVIFAAQVVSAAAACRSNHLVPHSHVVTQQPLLPFRANLTLSQACSPCNAVSSRVACTCTPPP